MGSESPTAVDTESAHTRAAAAAPTVSGRGVAEAFVALADTLVTGSDAADFMGVLAERCVELLGVDAAGLLVTDQRGELRLMAEQLQAALDSRVVIEQAKGVLAERHGWAMEEAFARLRGHARDRNRRLAEVAQEVVSYGGDLL
ncbi:ANTAR domain-containing protein [Nonomuraea sp. NPDC050022]|uniref:ANTAR domain-containing protein n=1 Tax=Nonomuraea sp. NPDC050022 TaxID=3364358 RepID=UPI00378920B9